MEKSHRFRIDALRPPRRGRRGWLLLAAVALVGCGQRGPVLVPVEGRVTWQGKPVTRGEICFVPTAGEAQPAVGIFSPDGDYVLMSHGGRRGVEPGRYQVAVRSYEGSFLAGTARYLVPEPFADPHASGLTAAVARDTRRFDFDLK